MPRNTDAIVEHEKGKKRERESEEKETLVDLVLDLSPRGVP